MYLDVSEFLTSCLTLSQELFVLDDTILLDTDSLDRTAVSFRDPLGIIFANSED